LGGFDHARSSLTLVEANLNTCVEDQSEDRDDMGSDAFGQDPVTRAQSTHPSYLQPRVHSSMLRVSLVRMGKTKMQGVAKM